MVEASQKPFHVLVTAPLLPAAQDILDAHFTVHRLWEQADGNAYLAAHGEQIQGVATTAQFGAVDAAFLALLPNLELISSFGVGYDQVDAAGAAQRGVLVSNTPGVLDADVADLALALTLATIRGIASADRYVRDGKWRVRAFPLSATLQGRTVGLVGMGRIGQAIAARFKGFEVPIAYHSRRQHDAVPYAYHDTIEGLAAACDVLIVIVPGGDQTRHLVNAATLAALGSDGILINVARGSVVDEQALMDALENGTILAAGLDVYEDEPHVPSRLTALENVVLLPHIGSGTVHTRNAMSRLVADNLVSWFAGQPLPTPVPEVTSLPLTRRPRPL